MADDVSVGTDRQLRTSTPSDFTEIQSLYHCFCVRDADITLLYVVIVGRQCRTLLLSGNRYDRFENSAHCAEWSQFAVDYFFRQSDLRSQITALQNEITLKAPPGEWIYN